MAVKLAGYLPAVPFLLGPQSYYHSTYSLFVSTSTSDGRHHCLALLDMSRRKLVKTPHWAQKVEQLSLGIQSLNQVTQTEELLSPY